MSPDLIIILLLLASAVVMFMRNRPRMDVVALLMIAALPLTGVITISEAIAGFSDSNIVLIALLFVLGEGLVRTGIARRLGDAIVAIFIPVVLRICQSTGTAPSRLMMPLSVAALISGHDDAGRPTLASRRKTRRGGRGAPANLSRLDRALRARGARGPGARQARFALGRAPPGARCSKASRRRATMTSPASPTTRKQALEATSTKFGRPRRVNSTISRVPFIMSAPPAGFPHTRQRRWASCGVRSSCVEVIRLQ